MDNRCTFPSHHSFDKASDAFYDLATFCFNSITFTETSSFNDGLEKYAEKN